MSTFYLDYINGSDANAGTSWALAWKTFTLGATAARIAPGDTIRVAKSSDPTSVGNSTWTTRPAVDVYNTITSSTNTSPIAITKAGHGLVTGDIVNIRGHNVNTSANGIWKISRINDDAFYLDNSIGVGTGGASGNFRKCNWQCVELPAGTTFNINRTGHEGNWTSAMAGVTPTADTTLSKEGRYSIKLACTTTATTGLAAYYATGDLDLSAYQQISFWFYSNIVLNDSDWKLCLCSDTAGSTIVYTANIPASPQTNRWLCVTVDTGSAMNTTIKSVALYQNVDKGACNVYVNNILACKAPTSNDSVTLKSLISQSSSAYGNMHEWYSITSIKDNILVIGEYSTVDLSVRPGYYGSTSGSVATYKREFITTDVVTYAAKVNSSTEAGNSANYITYSGGWNTSTNTQDGETWFGSYNGSGYGIDISHGYIKLERFGTVSYQEGFRLYPANYLDIDDIAAIGSAAVGIGFVSGTGNTVGTISSNGCNTYGISIAASNTTIDRILSSDASTSDAVRITGGSNIINTIDRICGGGNSGIEISSSNNYIGTISSIKWCGTEGIYFVSLIDSKVNLIEEIKYCTSYGIYMNAVHGIILNKITLIDSNGDSGIFLQDSEGIVIRNAGTVSNNTRYAVELHTSIIARVDISNMTTSGNSIGGIYCTKTSGIFLQNCTIGEAVEFAFNSSYYGYGGGIYSSCHDGNEDNHLQYFDNGVISSDVTTRHTASGISWKVQPATIYKNSYFPLKLSLAKIACNSGTEVTFKVWCKKDHATTVGAKLILYDGQLPGYTTQEDIKANDTDWEQLSVSFTPTKKGVVEIVGEVWFTGSVTADAVYFDDIEVTQA